MAAGCGDEGGGSEKPSGSAFERSVQNAQEVTVGDFPAASGRTLQEISRKLQPVQMGLATSVFTQGENRLAFGMVDTDNSFIYGKTAVYVAPTPNAPARGPFLAPADPLVIEPPFRSRNAATESDAIAAIYGARLQLRPGRHAVLAMTKPPTGPPVGGGVTIDVARSSPIPEVGERPPRVDTETVASAGGDLESIETRVPEDDMHEENFADVVGKKPVVLLFATPALCHTESVSPSRTSPPSSKRSTATVPLHPPTGFTAEPGAEGAPRAVCADWARDGAVALHLRLRGPSRSTDRGLVRHAGLPQSG